MIALIEVSHDLRTNTIAAVGIDADDQRIARSFSPIQVADLLETFGDPIKPYIDLAGWTPEYIAAVKKKEEDEAAEKQAIADAEEAERKAQKEKADQEAFDADVARQVKVLEEAKKIVDKQK